MRTPGFLISFLAICIAVPFGQNAIAQKATTGDDLCILDSGAKALSLFESQCLNSGLNEQGRELPLSSTKRRKGHLRFDQGKMVWKAGLMKDDSDKKLFGFGFGYHMTPSTSLSGQAGLGGRPYSPEETVTFGFRFDF